MFYNCLQSTFVLALDCTAGSAGSSGSVPGLNQFPMAQSVALVTHPVRDKSKVVLLTESFARAV